MIEATVSTHIDAPAESVLELYADPSRWPRVFPETIRSVEVTRVAGPERVVEVDHRQEGLVVNRLRRVSPTRLELEEWKRRYDATFSNEFVPERGGTRYTLRAFVRLKGPYRLLSPLVGPLVRARMRRFVLEPLRAAAERAERGK